MDHKEALIAHLEGMISERRRGLFDSIIAERTRYITAVVENATHFTDASAVLRSCEIFGVQEMHIISRDTVFKDTKGVSVGAGKWVNVYNHGKGKGSPAPTINTLAKLKERGYRIAAVSARPDGVPIDELPLDQKTALCFGSLENGLSEEIHEAATYHTYIPSAGFTKTFNISVCAALVLETLTARLRASKIDFRLTPQEQRDLRLEWLVLMPKRIGDILERWAEEQGLATEIYRDMKVGPGFEKTLTKHGVL